MHAMYVSTHSFYLFFFGGGVGSFASVQEHAAFGAQHLFCKRNE